MVSQFLDKAILKTGTPVFFPINPKTSIKIKGKAKLKSTADGLLNCPLKLALVIANIAFI
jgi:hypothetical protein